jgi:hypothetical protein
MTNTDRTRVALGYALAVAALSCETPTESPFPRLAGTYSATIRVTLNNSVEQFDVTTNGNEITIDRPDAAGVFTGQFSVRSVGPVIGTFGMLRGTVTADGAVAISEWAFDPGSPTEGVESLDWCDPIVPEPPLAGTVVNRQLTLSVSMTVQCNYGAGASAIKVPTEVSQTIDAVRR